MRRFSMTRPELATIFGVGALGSLAGHLSAYWVAHPHEHERHAVLESSGHGYFDTAIAAALVAASVALMSQFVFGYLDRSREGRAQDRGLSAFFVLAVVQMGIFLSVEVAERMLAGVPVGDAWHEAALWWGLPVQIVVAGLGAMVLRLLRRAGHLAATFSGLAMPVVVPTLATATAARQPVTLGHVHRASGRGPPLT